MNTIAAKLDRSAKTFHDHIKDHDARVERRDFCPSCRMVKSQFEVKNAGGG